jgi:hypothetical protein
MSRLLTTLAAGALCVLVVVPAGIAKEGVRAKLDTPLPLQAEPGETIPIAWTLSYSDRGVRRQFGASGVFVRLLSASGARPVRASGIEGRFGHYVAKVTVPEGGIDGIRIGLEGTRFIGGRAEDADVLFPIDNDPFAAAGAAVPNARDSRSSAPSAGGGHPLSIWLMAAAGLDPHHPPGVPFAAGYRGNLLERVICAEAAAPPATTSVRRSSCATGPLRR